MIDPIEPIFSLNNSVKISCHTYITVWLTGTPMDRGAKHMGVCVACVKKGNVDSIYSCTQKAPAKWLCSIGRMVIPAHTATYRVLQAIQFRETCPSRCDLRVTMRLKPPRKRGSVGIPRRILYWAAAPRDVHASKQVSSAECAYDKYSNMGVSVAKPGTDGRLVHTIDLRCPQPYVAEDPDTGASVMWSRHMHFVAVEEDDTVDVDTNKVHTLLVMPGTRVQRFMFDYECHSLFDPRESAHPSMFVGFQDYWRARRAGVVCINAVDHADYRPICTTDIVVTPPKTAGDEHEVEHTLLRKIQDSAKKHAHSMDLVLRLCSVPSLSRRGSQKGKRPRTRRRGKKGSGGHHEKTFTEAQERMLKRWPLLVYCVKPSCEAAKNLLFALDALGFHNIFYMPGGIEEARRQLAEVDATHLARTGAVSI